MVTTTGRFLATAFLLALWAVSASGQTPMSCVEELTIPRFLPTMMGFAPATGTIFLNIGHDGEISSVRFDSTKKLLNLELENTFRNGARYSSNCMGMTLSFTVTYIILRDEPRVDPVATVKFRAPNKFIVEFPPIKPLGLRHRSTKD
jgi:hypothetical protein